MEYTGNNRPEDTATVMYPEVPSPSKYQCALQLSGHAKPPDLPSPLSLFSGCMPTEAE